MECFAVTILLFLICFALIYTQRGGGKSGIITKTIVEYDTNVIHTKIAGVSYMNEDGTSRQAILKSLHPGDQLFLRHVPAPGHPEAIQVITSWGRQAGYISAELAEDVLEWFKDYQVYAYVTQITGGTRNKHTLGCNIVLRLQK